MLRELSRRVHLTMDAKTMQVAVHPHVHSLAACVLRLYRCHL